MSNIQAIGRRPTVREPRYQLLCLHQSCSAFTEACVGEAIRVCLVFPLKVSATTTLMTATMLQS